MSVVATLVKEWVGMISVCYIWVTVESFPVQPDTGAQAKAWDI